MRDDALDLFPVSPSEQEERPVRAVMRTLLAPVPPVEDGRSAPVRLPLGMRPVEALLTLGTLEALEAEPPLIVPPEPVSSGPAPPETSASVVVFPSPEPVRHERALARRTSRRRPASRYRASGAPATRRFAWAIAACFVVAVAVVPVAGGEPARGVSAEQVSLRAPGTTPGAFGGVSGREAKVLGSALVTVRPGDSLWTIAERTLGDPTRWRAIWKANRGRQMTSGERLTDPGLIRPGWRLRLPKH